MKTAKIFFIVASLLLISFLTFKVYQLSKDLNALKQNHEIHQEKLLKTIHNNGQLVLMANLMTSLEEELTISDTLSENSIRKIAALNHSFLEYEDKSIKGSPTLSPERGQLLQALALMKMDSASFSKIKKSTPFSYADLDGYNLQNIDLSGINLFGASLREADLEGADLSHALLKEADLWNTNLKMANLQQSIFFEADMQWANLSHANLAKADLQGVNGANAKFNKSYLKNANLQWGQFQNASFNYAQMDSVNLYGADLKQANMLKVKLPNAFMKSSNLSAVNMNNANLSNVDVIYAGVEPNWLEKLSEWQVIGTDSILAKYEIAPFEYKKYNYRLMPKK